MHPKRKARECAVQVLFLWESNGNADSDSADRALRAGTILESSSGSQAPLDANSRSDAMDMARGAWLEREAIDKRLEFHAPQWPPKRQPAVDRAILRLAVWELTHTKVSPKVVLDEAIELAKLYSTQNSPAFVNGVLDAILRENQGITTGVTELPPTL